MKKNILGKLLFFVILLATLFFAIDYSRILHSQQPIFMIEISHGSVFTGFKNKYYGLGYWGSGQQWSQNGEIMNYSFYFLGIEIVHHFG